MTTLLNSFAHARHAVFVSGFVRNEMSHYITHLASGIEKDYVPRAKLVEGHQEVVFVDVLKIETDGNGNQTSLSKEEVANELVRVLCVEIRAMDKDMRIFCAGLLT